VETSFSTPKAIQAIVCACQENREINQPREILQFADFLMNTDFTSEPSKIFFSNRFETIGSAWEKMKIHHEGVSRDSVKNKIFYDARKTEKHFSDMPYRIFKGSHDLLDEFGRILTELRAKHREKGMLDLMTKHILWEIPSDLIEVSELSEYNFESFLSAVAPHVVKRRLIDEEAITRDALGHVLFLLSYPDALRGNLIHRYNSLLRVISSEFGERLHFRPDPDDDMEIEFLDTNIEGDEYHAEQ
jgi:hypothetical protein